MIISINIKRWLQFRLLLDRLDELNINWIVMLRERSPPAGNWVISLINLVGKEIK